MYKTNMRDFIGLQFFAAPPAGDRLQEIETRLSQIRTEMDVPDADLQALSDEADNLLEERTTLKNQAQARRTLLGKIGSGAAGSVVPELRFQAQEAQEQRDGYGVDSPEYRTAWLKHLRNNELTDVEQRAFTTVTGSAGDAVPTTTANQILTKVRQYAPLLGKINLLRVPGMVTFVVEDTVTDAAYHAENAAITPSNDTLTRITLSAYELTKLVQISKSVMMMTIDAFETWLTDQLARKIAELISTTILTGTGSDQGTGIDKANTWDATNAVTVAKGAALTQADVLNLIALLPGGYDARAEFVMSKKTLFVDFMPLQDRNKNSIVTNEGHQYYIYGYPVTFDERVKDHEAYLADLYTVVGNMPEDITLTSAFDINTNSYKFLGCAMFDCVPSVPDATRKLCKATA